MPSEFTQQVINIAEKAGEILLAYFQKDFTTEFKNNDTFDPVTTADREADSFIRSELSKLFPEDEILSEENDHIPTDYSKRIWMIDPLDGTKHFTMGRNTFSILIGLWSPQGILFGLAYAPALKRLFYAEPGQGAFERAHGVERRINVSPEVDLHKSRVITRSPTSERRPLDPVIERLEVKEIIQYSEMKMCRVACGEAEATINTNFRAGKWDTLGPQLILQEAGGVICDIDGNALDYTQEDKHWRKSFIAANNEKIKDQILEVVRATKI